MNIKKSKHLVSSMILMHYSLLLSLRVADKDKDNKEKEDSVKSINYKGILFVTASLILGGASYLMGSDEGLTTVQKAA